MQDTAAGRHQGRASRMPMRVYMVFFLLCCSTIPLSRAQSVVYVSLETNLPEAIVFADSVRIGPARQGPFAVPAATHSLRLVPEHTDLWTIAPLTTDLDAEPGDTVSVRLDFPHYYRIESVPFGADVFEETPEGRRKLGTTPLDYRTPAPLGGRILVEKAGFTVARLVPGEEVWNRHTVLLQPAERVQQQASEIEWQPPDDRIGWLDYAALGLAATAGVLSIHYKFTADRLYREYRRTADPSLRPEIRQYDVRAAVALGTMQVGVGFFVLRLALR